MSGGFAVVGSGPAGFGVLTALIDSGTTAPITLFDIDRPLQRPQFSGEQSAESAEAFYESIYREIWHGQRRQFPPPKTHFSKALPKFDEGGATIYRGDSIGGLSNFWGGTLLPFTDRELAGWSITRADLEPHYWRMAEAIGIAGRPDALSRYFGDGFVNRPPVHVPSSVAALEQSIASAASSGDFEVLAGANRCAVETRADQPNSCVRCGECLTGCFRDSIFSTRRAVMRWVAEGRIKLVRGEVRSFDPKTRELIVGSDRHGPFDRIYLAAGCPNTTAIVLRSLGLRSSEPMADNAVYLFPVLQLGNSARADDGQLLALTNLIAGLSPRTADLDYAQVQLYPNVDYFWRYNVPPALWPLARGLVSWSRGRLFWARLYVHGRLSHAYSTGMRDGEIHFDYARQPDAWAADRPMAAIRSAFNRNGFWVPPLRPIMQRANSHYGATLPMGGSKIAVSESGEVAPGIHLCDSSVFPSVPAVSLSFTIFANANRTAQRSL